ncbi:hypothetical protein [Pseudohalioglobus lutimaris]|uniref:VPEID-CTERM sorting domain-containing protein n=1 Tax=Pseudohalioglobus lutimaris TaxID=1737061 RepID=A0A2N5WZF6_9GAMM|nr:hypothetical protein [Pseudohalioglobus lutimaris]PLW67586.1 hypothetical protein C0039_16245 [Pseudohalioglobus lutimaris]
MNKNLVKPLVFAALVGVSAGSLAIEVGCEEACGPPPGQSVPEIDGAMLPVALGLMSAFVLWRRDRKRH